MKSFKNYQPFKKKHTHRRAHATQQQNINIKKHQQHVCSIKTKQQYTNNKTISHPSQVECFHLKTIYLILNIPQHTSDNTDGKGDRRETKGNP